jgi:hypothetical protein
MMIDTLRTGWPEQILTGRYSFRTRSRDGLADILAHSVQLITDDLIEPQPRTMLHVRIGVVDGRRVARIRQVWHLFSREFRVDVSRVAGTLDPRLVLACALEELRRFSSY